MNIRIVAPVCLVLFLALAVSVGAAPEDTKSLDGTWLPTSAEMAGAKLSDEVVKSIKLILKGDKYTVHAGKSVDEGTVKSDKSKKPYTMDIVGTEGPNKGKTILAICELDGDTLKICYDLGGKDRPKEFMTKEGTQLFLVTYKREKP